MVAIRRLFLGLLFTLFSSGDAAEPKAVSFAGKYEGVMRGKSAFELEVEKTPDGFTVSFSAANDDGSGAAPDGGGVGKLNARGELEFTFEDSFGNKGRGVLKSDAKGHVLAIDITDVVEPRAIVHYGQRRMKRIAARASSKR